MANITVKKHDGTTDSIWTAQTAAAADTGPAVWRKDDVASDVPIGLRPTFTLRSKDNGPRTARQLIVSGFYPNSYLDASGVQYVAPDSMVFSGILTLPKNVPPATSQEAVQFFNLLASALIKSCVDVGYAPT